MPTLEVLHEAPKTGSQKGSLLLIHGACMGAWAWKGNFLPWFAQHGYDTYAISLRNHGGSEKEGKLRFKSVYEYVDDLRQAIKPLEGPVYLLGHSMGGFLIQHYFSGPVDPKVKKGVLLCASPAQGNLSVIPRLLSMVPWPFLKANLLLSWKPVFKSPANARKVMFTSSFPEEKLREVLEQMQDESFLAFLEMTALNLPNYKKIERPLLVVGAERDVLISEKSTRKLASLLGVSPLIVPGGSHNLMMEQGWEELAVNIETFLTA